MTIQRIFTVVICVVVLGFGFGGTASAQFGSLRKLKDKVEVKKPDKPAKPDDAAKPASTPPPSQSGLASADAKKPFMIGVLPFADKSGSGVQDLPSTVAREVAAQLALTPGLEAHVIQLASDVSPSDLTPAKAVEIARTEGVDAVFVGTLVQASSKQSDRNLGRFSSGKFGIGGNVHSMTATVALDGALYDVTTGKELDTVRASKDVSQTKVGGDVSTNIGDFSTGKNSFKTSPIGMAVQGAMESLAASIAADEPKMSHACIAPPGAFGSKDQTEASIEGKIYYLPENTSKLPDFASLTSVGSIFASKWDVPRRSFEEGFPGISDRFEWFAIDYNGPFYVAHGGDYRFHVSSDDGTIVAFDGRRVVDNDGIHAVADARGTIALSQGMHRIEISYFQGPRYSVALQIWVAPPGGAEKLLDMRDFNKAVADSRSLLGVTENANEIDVKFNAEVLFDTGKYDLKPAAEPSLEQLANLVKAYPGLPVVIEGHTDNVGSAESNQTLSENRAKAVKDWLMTKGGVSEACITTHGFGETKPVATNATAEGRQKNRRVEVHLMKPANLQKDDGA